MSLPAPSGPVVHQASALAVLIPQEEVSGGTLLVRPLSLDSLSEVSELLTEVPCRPSSHQSTPGCRTPLRAMLPPHVTTFPDSRYPARMLPPHMIAGLWCAAL